MCGGHLIPEPRPPGSGSDEPPLEFLLNESHPSRVFSCVVTAGELTLAIVPAQRDAEQAFEDLVEAHRALVLRTAQARFLTQQSGRRPVLLLDDVLLELDQGKKEAFLGRFPDYEQAFFTFLPEEAHASYATSDTLVLEVRRGELSR